MYIQIEKGIIRLPTGGRVFNVNSRKPSWFDYCQMPLEEDELMKDLQALEDQQLELFLYTIEGIMRQLEDLSPGQLPEEASKLHETLSQQAYVLQNRLILERVRRSMVKLQAQLAGE